MNLTVIVRVDADALLPQSVRSRVVCMNIFSECYDENEMDL
jgi:hypothetical protein